MLKVLIFDVDGTLAETERDGHRLAFNQAFAEVGLDWFWSVETYAELTEIGGGKERIAHYLEHYLQSPLEPQTESLQSGQSQTFTKDWIADLHQRKSRHYAALLQAGTIQPRPGVLRLLQEAQDQGIRLAIATTSALPNALTLLKSTLAPESVQWFEVIAAGDIVARKKPAPDIYQYVLDQLNVSPEDCLVFEDSQVGLTAAKGAGLATIVTVNDYTANQDFSAADLVITHLGEPDFPLQICGNAHHYLPNPKLNLSYVTVEMLKDFLNFLNTLRAASADG
ncbi:MAG: HAD family hydrolase [Prochlorotrichaceae cyanobacterium]